MLPGVLVSVVLAFVYALGVDGPWIWDDHMLIENSSVVTEGAELARYFREPLWTLDTGINGSLAFYRPLVVLSYRADWLLHHGSSAGFHLTNIVAFALCAMLAHAWLLRLKVHPVAAALTVAAWGASPRLVETVGWISGRTDLFAALFAFAALLTWPARDSKGRAFAARLFGSGLLLFAALLAKEVAVAAAIVLAVHALDERDRRRTAAALVTLAAVVGTYFALRTAALSAPHRHAASATFSLTRSLAALGTYVEMLVDPRPASLHGAPTVAPPWAVALGGLAAALGLAGLVVLRQRRHPRALLLLAGASLGPVLHVIPLPLDVLVTDRYLFVPMFGAYALVAYGAQQALVGAARRSAAAVATLFLVAEAPPLLRRIDDHRDELRFWVEAERTRTTPSARPLVEVGRILFEARRFEDTSRLLSFALSQHAFDSEEQPVARHNLALASFALGRMEAARRELETLASEHAPTLATRALAVDIAIATGRFDRADELVAAMPPEAASTSVVTTARARVVEARQAALELAPAEGRSPVDVLWSRARFASTFLGARNAERAWTALAAHPDASREARIAAVGALSEVGSPGALRAALENLVARDGESPFSREAFFVLAELERKWSRGAEVVRALHFGE